MRLFVGIELGERVRDSAARIADSLKRDLGERVDARWVAASNLHITLWFLGEVDEGRVAMVSTAIDRRFEERTFDLEIGSLGAFPPSGAPRVFWLGIRSGAASLARLHDELTVRLEPLGFKPERRSFSAHLTIARVRDVSRGVSYGDIREMVRAMPADAGSCRVEAVTLFRSRLSPKGATYDALLRVPLQ